MFISVSIDMATEDSKEAVVKILTEYGVKKVHENLYESFDFQAKKLGLLKKDLTESVDMDDSIRIYQFPLDDTFKISALQNGKWKRFSITTE